MEQDYSEQKNFFSYLRSSRANWYWGVVVLSLITVISFFVIPSDPNPLVVVRYLLGLLFTLFLPGFSLIKGFFQEGQLDVIQRLGLSLGVSVALVPLIALFLNFTPLGIGAESIVVGLLVVTFALATGAVFREYSVSIE